MESKIVTAAGISINGLLPQHAARVGQAMEREVLKHHALHGSLKHEHAADLKQRMQAAHDRHMTLIEAELEAQRLASELVHAGEVFDRASAALAKAKAERDAHVAVLDAAISVVQSDG